MLPSARPDASSACEREREGLGFRVAGFRVEWFRVRVAGFRA